MTNPNDNAFPKSVSGFEWHHGLTKREYFAAMALQGILANQHLSQIAINKLNPNEVADFYARTAQEHADALINQLNKPQK